MSKPHPEVTEPLTVLVMNERNPRTAWKPEQVEPFAASLRRFGDLGGIVSNLTSGQLVGGHKRIEVFRQSATARIVKVEQPEDAQGTVAHGYVEVDGARFAYREVRWTPEIEAAANLAANRWGAEWDWQLVSETLQGLADVPELLTLTGFPTHELDNLIAADWSPAAKTALAEDDPDHAHTVKLSVEQYDAVQRAKAKLAEGSTTPLPRSDGAVIALVCGEYLTHGD